MGTMKSLDIETDAHGGGKPRNPYGPGGSASPTASLSSTINSARTYFMFFMSLFVIYGLAKMMLPEEKSEEERLWASKGDAAGGWGAEHNHPVVGNSGVGSGAGSWNAPKTPKTPVSSPASSSFYDNDLGDTDLELRESDLLMAIVPLVFVPKHSRPEYEMYKTNGDGNDESFAEELLYDTNTPHGMAFDFMLNRDKRPVNPDDAQVTQRFVLTLLFYATGGKDSSPSSSTGGGGRASGWDSGMAHFLTGLHECHWVKKSLEDQFWGILSMESDTDRRVGVTKCNADMEVTEVRLADLNLVGFVPEEIKWLSSLESLDIQNNHLAGPIPGSLGELDQLRYLSLDGNNFSGTIPDVFDNMAHLERAYLNFNDFNGAMPPSLCTLREDAVLKDLWSDCGGYPITCTCCSVCCDMVAECNEMESNRGGV